MKPVSAARAFTLVEMLVVIGIIAVLIAVLLPVLGAVRAQSREVACADHLRSIDHALRTRAAEHGGYLPLAGRVAVSTFGPPLSVSLGDPERRRYDYVHDSLKPGGERPMPWPAALSKFLGDSSPSIVTEADVFNWASRTSSPSITTLNCPAASPAESAIVDSIDSVVDVSSELNVINLSMGYAVNSEAFGFDATAGVNAANIRLERISNPSRVLLLADARSIGTGLWWEIPAGTATGPFSFGQTVGQGAAANDLFDRTRHRGRVNIAFADGHVEPRAIATKAFVDVLLSVGSPH